ncbi:MAG: endonuclease Q family protein [Bacteroidota bacterium]
MPFIADLHVHSPYAMATSKYLSLASLYQWARIKGIDVVGTGDFTHPAWFDNLKQNLVGDGSGLYRLKEPPHTSFIPEINPKPIDVRFCLSTEISCIYTHKKRVRKGHYLVYAPDLDTVEAINKQLSKIGNLAADGRPILGISARNLLEVLLHISARIHLIPAHAWTPWFSIFGSKSGYDTIEDCFEDLSHHIFALETGLSSDPAMNWHISALDRYTMVSNSDAHSPQNLGREASLFSTSYSYDAIFEAIKTRKGFEGTLEFFPQEGKYHLDGHRVCKVCLTPAQTKAHQSICPTCGKSVTVGVLHRVHALADRKKAKKPADAPDFEYIVPLPEIIAEIVEKGVKTKAVEKVFVQTINRFGNEFYFLRKALLHDISHYLGPVYSLAIDRLRKGLAKVAPGYDGQYGTVSLYPNSSKNATQLPLLR